MRSRGARASGLTRPEPVCVPSQGPASRLIDATLAPEGRERYRGTELVAVDDASYDVVREAYAALGLIPE